MTLKGLGQLLVCVYNSRTVITNNTAKLKLTLQQIRKTVRAELRFMLKLKILVEKAVVHLFCE